MLSQRARYSIKALIALTRRNGAITPVRKLAEEANIPRRYLEAIMVDLRKRGFVESVQGNAGGYRLRTPANQISFADIIRHVDGSLSLVSCVSRDFYSRCEDCPDEQSCELRQTMALVRSRVSDILDHTTLANATADVSDLRGEGIDRLPTAELSG